MPARDDESRASEASRTSRGGEAGATRPRYRFGPEKRVRKRAEFVRAQRRGQRATTSHFVLLVASRSAAPPAEQVGPPASARLGVVVTKKVGNAVERNRIKRLCRECFRLWPDFVPAGIDLIVIARAGAETLGLAEVHEEWRRARATVLRRCAAALGAPR